MAHPDSARPRALRTLAAGALLALFAGCAASGAFRTGKRAYDLGDYDKAVLELSRAAAQDPRNLEYRSALHRAREKASAMHSDRGRIYLGAGRYQDAVAEFAMAVAVFPGNTYAADQLDRTQKLLEEQKRRGLPSGRDLEEAKRKASRELGVPKLKPRNTDPISIDVEDKPQRQALDAISRATGISFIYDERLEQDLDRKRISLHLRNVSFDEAMEIILAKTGTMYKIYNETTLLLAPSNPESERKYQDQVMKTFYLSNAQAKDVFQQVRSLIDVKKLSQNEQLNSITIRGTPDQVQMAQKIIDLNDKSKGEVVIDVEIIEVNRTTSETLGLMIEPRSLALTNVNAQVPFINWREAVFGKHNYKIGPLPSVALNFLRTDTASKTLANPSVRVTEGEKADLHIGDRFPIFNCTTNLGGGTGGTFQTCTPTYTDIGIQIKIEPRVHHNHEVTIKLDLKVSTLGASVSSGGQNAQTANAIGERSINTVIRMADGESEMLAGMLRDDNTVGLSGYPGINDVPLLNALFGERKKGHNQTDVILLLTPHIIRFPNITDEDLEPIWVGTDDNPKLARPGSGLNITATDEAPPAAAPAEPAPAPAADALPAKPPVAPPAAEPAPEPPVETPPEAPPSLVSLTLSPSTLHFSAGATGEFRILLVGTTPLAQLNFTIRHGQLPISCASVQAGEIFTQGGIQPMVQFNNLPGGDCQVSISRPGGSGTLATGEAVLIGLTSPARGTDIINAIALEGLDGKGRAVPLSATPLQVVVD